MEKTKWICSKRITWVKNAISNYKSKTRKFTRKTNSKIIDNAEDISITLKETQRLTKLIKVLMDLARNDANRAVINKEQFNLDDEIKSIILLYKETAKSQQKDFCIDLKYNGTITADLNKIKQLLVILLDNALKYTEKMIAL